VSGKDIADQKVNFRCASLLMSIYFITNFTKLYSINQGKQVYLPVSLSQEFEREKQTIKIWRFFCSRLTGSVQSNS
jgi:hypothetical protein